jgi:RNA polymerase sigma-70 factor, ECF subfamily
MPAPSVSLEDSADNPPADWFRAARRGSREAIGKLLETCRTYLLLVANRELPGDLRAKGGASDLVQDTFLLGHRDFGRFKGETEAELLAWLRGILLHNLANFERRYRGTAKRKIAREMPLGLSYGGEVPLAGATPTPSWHAVAREDAVALEGAIARLPLDCRRIIYLVHYENLSFADAAVAMERSIDAARRLWARALELLADELEGPDGRR